MLSLRSRRNILQLWYDAIVKTDSLHKLREVISGNRMQVLIR